MKILCILLLVFHCPKLIAQTKDEFCKVIENYLKNNQTDSASIYVDSILKNIKDCALCYHAKGVIHLRLNDYSSAINYFNLAIAINDSTIQDQVLSNKAFAFRKLRRYPEAFSLYDESLEFNPLNANSLTGKGELLVYFYHDLERGSVLIQKAYQINPNDPGVQFNFARLMITLRKPERALEVLQKIPMDDPLKPALLFLMGESYMQLKKYDSALDHYELAKKYGDDFISKEVDYITNEIKKLPEYKE